MRSGVLRRLPLLALPVAPIQGLWVKRRVARFPEAEGRTGQAGAGERRLRLVAIGDSVAAGYAVPHHRETVTGVWAQLLAERFDATVEWEVLGISGSTAGEAVAQVNPEILGAADFVFVSIGVNDAKNGHSATRYQSELGALLDAILTAAPRALLCQLGIPPLEEFPLLPRPLADAMGWRGRVFDRIAQREAFKRPRVIRVEAEGPMEEEMFGPDGFHPSEYLHAWFATGAMAAMPPTWTPTPR